MFYIIVICLISEYTIIHHIIIGTLLSEHFLSKFMEWKGSFIVIPKHSLGRYPQALQDMLLCFSGGFLKEQLAKTELAPLAMAVEDVESYTEQRHMYHGSSSVATSQVKRKTKTISTPMQDILQIATVAASRVKIDATNVQSSLTNIYKQAVSRGNESGEYGDLVPIVDFSGSSMEDIRLLVGLFSADDAVTIQSMNRLQLLGRLSRFIPYKPTCLLSDACNHTYASKSTQGSSLAIKLAAIFGSEKKSICDKCVDHYCRKHAKEWIEQGVKFIKAGTLADLKTALACVKLAIILNVERKQIVVVVRELLMHDLPEVALPMVLSIRQQSVTGVDKAKSSKLLSSVLKGMAGKFDNWDMQWPLLFAAKEACLLESCSLDDSVVETVNLQSTIIELNGALNTGEKIMEQEQEHMIRGRVQTLEKLWTSRDLKSIIKLLKESRTAEDDSNNLTLKALEAFLRTKEARLSMMLPADSNSLIFLRGVLKLFRQRYIEGAADIEQVTWCAVSLDHLREEAIDILLSLLTNKPSLFTLKNLYITLTTNQHRLFNRDHVSSQSTSHLPRDLHLLIPDKKELMPPFSRNWPELTVSGLNLRAHHKCEEAFDRQIKEGKWGHRDLGFAYIDYVQGCNHPAESAISLLHASLWFLKDFQSKPQMEVAEKFALKKLVLHCLELAYGIAHMSLHPGMQLYIGSIALKTALEVLSISGNVALPEDTKLVSSLLHTVTYNSRFVPFWKFPPVPVSEAVLLSIISGKLHSQYLLQLKQVHHEQRPITKAELCYQLYENDLRCVHPLKDPDRAHVEAMEELLHEKGWTMSDVVDLMTSPLSRRDSDGWLVPQPKLGSPQEYSEIKGMVLNLDSECPSIELAIVPADNSRGRLGTFNQTDFQDVISMVLDEEYTGTLSFSLDQPDENKRFHPFQEFSYRPETLQKTNILHTLFETDYLLKSFSVGTEVSANPPFNQRLNTSGLTQKLPHHLKQKLRPVSERGPTLSRANRFWIQADKIVYDEELKNSTLEIRLGNMDMVVRSHPLIPGEDGKLKDTAKDEDPDSPESKFAADLTENYNELGLHFPMFLRLRELAKLQVLGLFLRGTLKDMKDKAKGIGVTVPDEMLHEIQCNALKSIKSQLSDNLDSISAEIGIWPEEMDRTTVSVEVNRVLRELPYNVQASYSDVEPHVESAFRQALQQKNQNVLSQVVESLLKASEERLSQNTLTTYVLSWLSRRTHNEKEDLVNYVSSVVPLPDRDTIKRQIVSMFQKRYDIFKGHLRYLRSPLRKQEESPCRWVPAAFRREKDGEHLSLCYGGVLIAPKVTKSSYSVPPTFPWHSQLVTVCTSIYQPTSRTVISTTPSAPRPRLSHYPRRGQSSNVRMPAWNGLPDGSIPAAATRPVRSQPHTACPQGKNSGWKFTEDPNQGYNQMKTGTLLCRTLQDYYGDQDTSDYGSGSDSGGYTFTVALAIALSSILIDRLLDHFKEKQLQAKSALEQISKDAYVLPPCRHKSCSACVRKGDIQPVINFKASDGVTYSVKPQPRLDTRYSIYMVKCRITGKQYVGMTTRKAFVRIEEHLKNIAKQKTKTLPRHFNKLGCFGQFDRYMDVSPIAYISEQTLKPFSASQRRRIITHVEGHIILLMDPGLTLNRVIPNPSFNDLELPPNLFRITNEGNVIVDGRMTFIKS